ncbi:hypothetical protein ACRDNQ_05910 [Palleronia sp. KMU-117]|uniref:hypothetical protein n=1 Tax=Palleronia sp. KMU-117 TaxID=3434108 RepID=UPI003D7347B1
MCSDRAGQALAVDEASELEEDLLDMGGVPHMEPSRSWERSFPRSTIEGARWMIDVLDDLIAFSKDRELFQIAADLQEARDKVHKKLLG